MDLNTIKEVARPKARGELSGWRDGDAFLGGGTWLFSEPQPKLTRLVDLAALGWQPLTVSAEGLEIAATCTVAQLDALTLPVEWTAAPLIGQCCRAFLASFKVWNAATVGGNICLALPAGPMISLTAALDGEALLWAADSSERRLKIVDVVTGPQKNALRPGEVMRSISVPAAALTTRTAYRQVSLANHGRSGALVIGTRAANGSFALTITASTPRPIRLRYDALPTIDTLRADIEAAVDVWYDDIHGLPAWRRHMTLHFAQEILAELSAGAR
ncbi:MAG: FAD binding domain-containing protein [Pseudolabrys sp.]|nr:FAD binding domain-containing protein [Pseudolabrys sp.]